MSKPKVIFDTVVFVRSLLNPQSFWGRLVFKHTSDYRLIVSPQILVEILEVLQRPELTAKFPVLQGRDIKTILQIIGQAEVVEVSNIPSVSRDPKDDKFIATALKAKAHYLVSADLDLLDLKAYAGVKIIDAETFLKLLESQN